MSRIPTTRRSGGVRRVLPGALPALGLLLASFGVVGPVSAQSELEQEALQAQQTQAELQAKIDAADESVRERIAELRQAEEEARRLESYNRALAPQVESLEQKLGERENAIATLAETGEALPGLLNDMTERLSAWVEQDIPFLRDERLARVASLESDLANPSLSDSAKLEKVLGAWKAELNYGRELDAWRSTLDDEGGRQVDFLRMGRVGWYYLTPDGQEGGVWDVASSGWKPLDAGARKELAKGLRVVRDQRAPELLNLPLSQPLSAAAESQAQEGRS